MIATILSFLVKGTLFILQSMVVLCGVGAVVFVILFVLKFIVGALAKALGITGSSGGGGAVGGLLNTVNRGINGIFSGVGTVFNGVANTAGMTRDKILGNNRNNNHNYNNRNNIYDNYNDDYGYSNQRYNRRGRKKSNFYDTHDQPYYNNNLYSESPISNKAGDPNDPTDQYFTVKRYYDEDGFDQFGFNKDGKHKDEVMKELLDKKKKEKSNKISDLYQDKEFSDSEVANQWIKDARFKKPSTWMYGAVGLTYAAAHGIGKALNKDVPDDWKNLENKDSGIQKTVDMTQEDINIAEERKEYAPDGGITAKDLTDYSLSQNVKENNVEDIKQEYAQDNIFEEIEKHKMKSKVPVYANYEHEEENQKKAEIENNTFTWDSGNDFSLDGSNIADTTDLNMSFSDEDLGLLDNLEDNIQDEDSKVSKYSQKDLNELNVTKIQ